MADHMMALEIWQDRAISLTNGAILTAGMMLIQSRVDWARRGVATSLNMFMRIIGSALGAAVLGGVLNSGLRHYLTRHGGHAAAREIANIHNLLEGPGRHLTVGDTRLLRDALVFGLDHVFWGVALFATLTLILTLLVPRIEGD